MKCGSKLFLITCAAMLLCYSASTLGQTKPVADAGSDQILAWNVDAVMLDGSASYDPGGKPLTYHWTHLKGYSLGTIPILSDPAAVKPTYMGPWPFDVWQLVVNNGEVDSDPDVVSIMQEENYGTLVLTPGGVKDGMTQTFLVSTWTGSGVASVTLYVGIWGGQPEVIQTISCQRTSESDDFLWSGSWQVHSLHEDGGCDNDGRYDVWINVELQPGVTEKTSDGAVISGCLNYFIEGEPPPSAPTACFTYHPNNPTTQDVVQFTDCSTDPDGTITSWSWNFGDGATSTLKNPTHQYANADTYTVNLQVADNDGATSNASHDISVTNVGPNADFAFDPVHPLIDESVQFTDLSSDVDGTITSWTWDFGDAESSSTQNPTHAYAMGGIYTVQLTVTDDDGAGDTAEKQIEVINCTDFINFGPNPVTSDGCVFWLCLPDDTAGATLKIFDVDGALLLSASLDPTDDRYPAAGRWLPEDDQGRLLGTGLYLYLVEIEHTDGSVTYSPVQKMVIQR